MIGALLERNPRFANWLYGFQPPERGPVVLVHRRVYILPARMGWLFAVALIILLVGSINYQLGLGFALTFLLAGLGLVGTVHTARNLARIAVSVGRAEPVFAGEPAQFRLHLDGRAAFDRPAILARHLGSGSQLVVDIPALGIAEVVLEARAERRGWLPIGRLMLETRYPLGLFRAWSYVEPDARCLVYPKPERAPLPLAAALSASGGQRSPAAGNEDFSGLRTYQMSDSPRHVAWKAVARSDDMLTKQFAGEAAAELCLDWALLPPGLGTEQRLSRLTGWVLAAERGGMRYGMRIPGTQIAPGRGDSHAAACLQALALYPAS
jgi:uncharacterized protein (DUF58 family)